MAVATRTYSHRGETAYEDTRAHPGKPAARRLRRARAALRCAASAHQSRGAWGGGRVAPAALAVTAPEQHPELAGYFHEAASWDGDRVTEYRMSAHRAWRVAAAAGICTVACATALVLLLPLKHVEPFVIRVDNSTGVVDVVPIY